MLYGFIGYERTNRALAPIGRLAAGLSSRQHRGPKFFMVRRGCARLIYDCDAVLQCLPSLLFKNHPIRKSSNFHTLDLYL